MSVYTVFQEGVYRHTCMGVFDSLEAAIAAADRSAAEDVDSYHSYDVFLFELNEYNGEGSALYSINKNKALIKMLRPHVGECEKVQNTWRRNRSACSRGTLGCVGDVNRPTPQSGTQQGDGNG